MDHSPVKLAIFCSGSGSNAEKIIDYFATHPFISVRLLLSNNEKAFALERARRKGIKTRTFNKGEFYNSDSIVKELTDMGITWIILAGFLWLVPEKLINAFTDRIINIHPALLPKYGGKGMYGMHVHQAVIDAEEKETGISIHLVNPVYDQGEILFQASCPVEQGESPESVAKKVQVLEHMYFPEVIERQIMKEAGKHF